MSGFGWVETGYELNMGGPMWVNNEWIEMGQVKMGQAIPKPDPTRFPS